METCDVNINTTLKTQVFKDSSFPRDFAPGDADLNTIFDPQLLWQQQVFLLARQLYVEPFWHLWQVYSHYAKSQFLFMSHC